MRIQECLHARPPDLCHPNPDGEDQGRGVFGTLLNMLTLKGSSLAQGICCTSDVS